MSSLAKNEDPYYQQDTTKRVNYLNDKVIRQIFVKVVNNLIDSLEESLEKSYSNTPMAGKQEWRKVFKRETLDLDETPLMTSRLSAQFTQLSCFFDQIDMKQQDIERLMKQRQNYEQLLSVLEVTHAELEDPIHALVFIELIQRTTFSKMQIRFIRELICQFSIFKNNQNLNKEQDIDIKLLLKHLKLETFDRRQKIFEFGELGQKYYMLLRGSVLLFIPKGIENEDVNQTARLHLQHEEDQYYKKRYPDMFNKKELLPGESFGEISLLTNQTRTATMVCRDDCWLLTLNKEGFDKLISNIHQQQVEKNAQFMCQFEMIQALSQNKIHSMLHNVSTQKFSYNHIIYSENQPSNLIYFIKKGQVEISKLAPLFIKQLTQSQEDDDTPSQNQWSAKDIQGAPEQKNLSKKQKQLYNLNRNNKHSDKIQKCRRINIAILSENTYFGHQEINSSNPLVRKYQAKCVSEEVELLIIQKDILITYLSASKGIDIFLSMQQKQVQWKDYKLNKQVETLSLMKSTNSGNVSSSSTSLNKSKLLLSQSFQGNSQESSPSQKKTVLTPEEKRNFYQQTEKTGASKSQFCNNHLYLQKEKQDEQSNEQKDQRRLQLQYSIYIKKTQDINESPIFLSPQNKPIKKNPSIKEIVRNSQIGLPGFSQNNCQDFTKIGRGSEQNSRTKTGNEEFLLDHDGGHLSKFTFSDAVGGIDRFKQQNDEESSPPQGQKEKILNIFKKHGQQSIGISNIQEAQQIQNRILFHQFSGEQINSIDKTQSSLNGTDQRLMKKLSTSSTVAASDNHQLISQITLKNLELTQQSESNETSCTASGHKSTIFNHSKKSCHSTLKNKSIQSCDGFSPQQNRKNPCLQSNLQPAILQKVQQEDSSGAKQSQKSGIASPQFQNSDEYYTDCGRLTTYQGSFSNHRRVVGQEQEFKLSLKKAQENNQLQNLNYYYSSLSSTPSHPLSTLPNQKQSESLNKQNETDFHQSKYGHFVTQANSFSNHNNEEASQLSSMPNNISDFKQQYIKNLNYRTQQKEQILQAITRNSPMKQDGHGLFYDINVEKKTNQPKKFKFELLPPKNASVTQSQMSNGNTSQVQTQATSKNQTMIVNSNTLSLPNLEHNFPQPPPSLDMRQQVLTKKNPTIFSDVVVQNIKGSIIKNRKLMFHTQQNSICQQEIHDGESDKQKLEQAEPNNSPQLKHQTKAPLQFPMLSNQIGGTFSCTKRQVNTTRHAEKTENPKYKIRFSQSPR